MVEVESELRTLLQKHFGFGDFRPGQLDAMRPLIEGRDSLVVMPTGAGKSLCYQLPALFKSGTALVISPLIALMKDQVDALQACGIPATCIHSGLGEGEVGTRLQEWVEGHWQLLYVSPERLRHGGFRRIAQRVEIAFVAVDEAHCISQWGHDFRPEYREIQDFVQGLGQRRPIVALTATATPHVQDDIVQQLGLERPYRQVSGFNRPNLRLEVRFTPELALKRRTLIGFIESQPREASGIVYVGRRRDADEVSRFLADSGYKAVPYHAGMPNWERNTNQDGWMSGQAHIVVATNAFGMGVDKPNVRYVVHYSIPPTVEAYYQEAGRAGRDGDPAHCLLLSDPGDTRLQEYFIENEFPELNDLRELYAELRTQAQASAGRITSNASLLAAVMGWKLEVKARTALKLLEEAGLLEFLGEQGAATHWRFLAPKERVDMLTPLRRVQEQQQLRRRLLQTILQYAQSYHCRRQFLLDYFGDATPPVAAWCCDNCQQAANPTAHTTASKPEEKAALAVLDAVQNLNYGVGRVLLAKIVGGARTKGMERYYEHPQFGLLRYMNQKSLTRLVDDLIRERYLFVESGKNGNYPLVALTPLGAQAVKGRFAIATGSGIESLPQLSHTVSSARESDTTLATLNHYEEGLSPEQIADLRNLTLGTIYNHLARLIELGQVDVRRVVPDKVREQIEAAVREVGTFYLSPIRARLPEEVSYGAIRCVVQAMQHDGITLADEETHSAGEPETG